MAIALTRLRDLCLLRSRLEDYPVVDSVGAGCGIVDDIELENVRGIELHARALLIRVDLERPLWVQRCARLVSRGQIVRVAWSEVRVVGRRMELLNPASHYGLGMTLPTRP